MLPTTYVHDNNTFEVQIMEVQPQWACASLYSHRCVIGNWNFNCTHFVDIAQGHGNSPLAAYESAIRDLSNPIPKNEDAMMMLGA